MNRNSNVKNIVIYLYSKIEKNNIGVRIANKISEEKYNA